MWLEAEGEQANLQALADLAKALPRRKVGGRKSVRQTQTKAQLKLVPFNAARYLNDDEAIAEYMMSVLETNDPDLLAMAHDDIARAKGGAQPA
jgi:hypothetical protein